MVSMVAGLLAGWMVARLALSRLRDDLDLTNRRLKLQNMKLERERFNLSRAQLQSLDADDDASQHDADASDTPVDSSTLHAGLTEEIDGLQLENDLLRSEYALETAVLRDRILALEEQLNQRFVGQEAVYEDLDGLVEPDEIELDEVEPDEIEPPEVRVQEKKAKPTAPDTFRFGMHWVEPPAPRPVAGKKVPPKIEKPVFKPVINMMTGADTSAGTTNSALQSLLGLNSELFHMLRDAGYTNVDRIARLTPAEVDALSELLRIPAARIEMRWIPDAQMAQFSPEFSSKFSEGLNNGPGSETPES